MVDTTGAERGAFNEEDARTADRATPSVAEAGGANGQKPLWMWLAMAAGIALTIWFVVIIPMRNEAVVETVVDPSPVEVDRSQRAVDRTFPGTGFDLTTPAPEGTAPAQPTTEGTTQRERALMLQIESLQLQLQKAQEESAQQARAAALRLQIEAAQRAEAERVKRLRSDVLIGDYSDDDTEETGPRDLPNESEQVEEDANAANAVEPVDAPAQVDPIVPIDPVQALDDAPGAQGGQAGTIPPALIELMGGQGLSATPGGQE